MNEQNLDWSIFEDIPPKNSYFLLQFEHFIYNVLCKYLFIILLHLNCMITSAKLRTVFLPFLLFESITGTSKQLHVSWVLTSVNFDLPGVPFHLWVVASHFEAPLFCMQHFLLAKTVFSGEIIKVIFELHHLCSKVCIISKAFNFQYPTLSPLYSSSCVSQLRLKLLNEFLSKKKHTNC